MTRPVRLLAGDLCIDGGYISWRDDAEHPDFTLFDSFRSLLDWLDFQRDCQASTGFREIVVVTVGHVILPAIVAGSPGDYLEPEVLLAGQWRYHAPRQYGWRLRPSGPPRLSVVS